MTVLLLIIDQLTKWYAVAKKPSFDVLGNFFRIHYTENTGTIFGLFEGTNLIFIVLSVILCFVIAVYMKKEIPKRSFKEKCFALILTGGIGNLIDRIFRGCVIDFLSLRWVGIFNFADMYIVIGVALIIIDELKELVKNGDASRKSKYNE